MNQWPIIKEAFKEFLAIIGGLLRVIFVVVSSLAIFCYFIALSEKIRRPSFKNLDTGGFIILGFVVLGLGVCNYFIMQKVIRRMRS
jgi:predicted membrane channel-forming protein YqfA (hemolysin III family)